MSSENLDFKTKSIAFNYSVWSRHRDQRRRRQTYGSGILHHLVCIYWRYSVGFEWISSQVSRCCIAQGNFTLKMLITWEEEVLHLNHSDFFASIHFRWIAENAGDWEWITECGLHQLLFICEMVGNWPNSLTPTYPDLKVFLINIWMKMTNNLNSWIQLQTVHFESILKFHSNRKKIVMKKISFTFASHLR